MPEFFSILRSRFRALLKRRQLERDLQDEIAFHLAEKQTELESSGFPSDEAQTLVRRQFGNATLLKESSREAWLFRSLDNSVRDAKYAVRILEKAPAFTCIAVLTLAFGIGANTAIFSVINSVVLHALPYQKPDQLYAIREAAQVGPQHFPLNCVNAGNFLLWQKYSHSFAGMALLEPITDNLNLKDETVQIHGVRASSNLFSILGIPLQIGRPFTPAEDKSGRATAVILTNSLWRERFHSDPAIVGSTIRINGFPLEIAGVLRESFYFPKQSESYASPIAGWTYPIEYFVNLGLQQNSETRPGFHNLNFSVISRLRPGVTPKQAAAELDPIEAEVSKDDASGAQLHVDLAPLKTAIVGRVEHNLWILMSGAGLVLVLVCVNLAGLLIAKSTGRIHEIGVRVALGASRGDILRQFLIEALLLSVTGGVLGVVAAYAGTRMLTAAAPVEIPRLQSVTIDARVLIFTGAISVATAIAFSLLPALRLTGFRSSGTLKTAGPTTTPTFSTSIIHQALAASEIALCTVLLICALLIAKSLVRVLKANEWANVSHVIAINFTIPASRYQSDSQRGQLYTRLVDGAHNYPGVAEAGIVNALPFKGEMWDDGVNFKEARKPGKEWPTANWRFISPDYFRAIGLPLIKGRYLLTSDYGEHRVVISQRLARQLPHGTDAVGIHIVWTPPSASKAVLYEIVGVVADARATPDEEAPFTVYVPYWEWPPWEAALVVQTAGDPRSVALGMQSLIRRIDSQIAIPHAETMGDILSEAVAPRRFVTFLGLLFAASATFLAGLGLYGLISLSASQKTREIGIRIAVGAQTGQIFRAMLSQAVGLAVVGLVCGVAFAWAVTRLLIAFLYEVKPGDPLTFACVCAGLLGVALVASYAPARRAARVDPVVALKWE